MSSILAKHNSNAKHVLPPASSNGSVGLKIERSRTRLSATVRVGSLISFIINGNFRPLNHHHHLNPTVGRTVRNWQNLLPVARSHRALPANWRLILYNDTFAMDKLSISAILSAFPARVRVRVRSLIAIGASREKSRRFDYHYCRCCYCYKAKASHSSGQRARQSNGQLATRATSFKI